MLQKHFLPWTAADRFETHEAFQAWLRKKHRLFTDLRMLLLVPAAFFLIAGYVLDRRSLMILTVAPLLLVLLLSAALDKTEGAMDGQNNSTST